MPHTKLLWNHIFLTSWNFRLSPGFNWPSIPENVLRLWINPAPSPTSREGARCALWDRTETETSCQVVRQPARVFQICCVKWWWTEMTEPEVPLTALVQWAEKCLSVSHHCSNAKAWQYLYWNNCIPSLTGHMCLFGSGQGPTQVPRCVCFSLFSYNSTLLWQA